MVDDVLALDRQVCFSLAATSRSVIGLYRTILEPMGLTHPQYLVMLALWEREPRSVKDLAETLYLEPATVTPLVQRLERSGLVRRSRNPEDERHARVELTAKGRDLRTQATDVPGTVIERLGIPVEQLEQLRDSLIGLLTASQAATRK